MPFAPFMTQAVPYWQTLGLELKEVLPGRAVFEAMVRPGLLQNDNALHGGAGFDRRFGVRGSSHLNGLSGGLRINLQLSYLKRCAKADSAPRAAASAPGRRFMFCEASVFDDQGALVCTAVFAAHGTSAEDVRKRSAPKFRGSNCT